MTRESDSKRTLAGELHLRATVVDDDGRTESFRRLKVRVAGPEGFGKEVALEATGAGAYAASVPLDTPGAYIATAVDELTGDPVGTTGAVLTHGEELRPTGSDRALLSRIAEMSGGKTRDTLAGIFNDRESRRFAYRSIDGILIWIAALTLLTGVGARRIALPEWLSGLPARLKRRKRQLDSRVETKPTPKPTLGALLDRKAQSDGRTRSSEETAGPASPTAVQPRAPARSPSRTQPARSAPPAPGGAVKPTGEEAAPASVPHFSRASSPGKPAGQTGARPLTAAEILLQRRRGRR